MVSESDVPRDAHRGRRGGVRAMHPARAEARLVALRRSRHAGAAPRLTGWRAAP